jgi:tetratricopeptide (TPR) repeat protein
MSRRIDKRLPALLLTAGVIGVLGMVIQLWPDSEAQQLETAPGQPAAPQQLVWKEEVNERFQQGVMMLHAGRYEYAVAAFRRVLELSPEMPEAHVNMGFAQFGQSHYALARDFFRSAIELRASQVNAYWGLAVSLEALCDIPGAIGAMRTYSHLADKDDRFQRKAQSALWEWEAADAGESDCKKT